MKPLNPGESRRVGRYQLVAQLGEGGMGRVLLGVAQDGRLAAIKQVHPGFAHDEGFRSRFRREVETSRMVSGAYTAAVMDADPNASMPWLASVFVAGPSLKDAIEAAGPLPVQAVRFLAVGLASALTEIHRVGLIHRDLKPSNVLLTDDSPRVIDFGIARAAEGDTELTHTGSIIGSPGFMSPEQADGRPVTPASDVFALGALLVMAGTGQGPFTGTSTPQTLYNVVHSTPNLGDLNPELQRLVEPCLAKDPASRPTPEQILDFLGTVSPSATPWPPIVHTMIKDQKAEVNTALSLPVAESEIPAIPKKRRGPLIAGIALASVVILGGATTAVVLANGGSSAAPSSSTPAASPPNPLNLGELRKVDPCALLGKDATPKVGPITGPKDQEVEFDKCNYQYTSTASGKSSEVQIYLAKSTGGMSGDPAKVAGMDAIQTSLGSACDVTVPNPTSPGSGLGASTNDDTPDCAVAKEFATALINALRTGKPKLYPSGGGSSVQVDFCTVVPRQQLEQAMNESFQTSADGLHECNWQGKEQYSISLLRATGAAEGLTGSDVKQLAGIKVLDERDESSCKISWLQRRVTSTVAEEITLSHTLDDKEKTDFDHACSLNRQFAQIVIAAMPKA